MDVVTQPAYRIHMRNSEWVGKYKQYILEHTYNTSHNPPRKTPLVKASMATSSSKHSPRNRDSLPSSPRDRERELGLVSRQINIPESELEPELEPEPDQQSFLAEASSESDLDGDGEVGVQKEDVLEADSRHISHGLSQGSNLKKEEKVTSASTENRKGDLQLRSLIVEGYGRLSPYENSMDSRNDQQDRQITVPFRMEGGLDEKRYFKLDFDEDDSELQQILQKKLRREGVEMATEDKKIKRPKFSDLIFAPRLTIFDRHNTERSSFRGFYMLWWLGIFFLVVKIGIRNWNLHGSIMGGNEILKFMLRRDLIVLGLTDGVMCASTTFSLLLQRLILSGYLSWDRLGWVIQNVSFHFDAIAIILLYNVVTVGFRIKTAVAILSSSDLEISLSCSVNFQTITLS